MDNFKLPEKLFFKEREVIKITKLSKKVLDYWIDLFPFLSIQKNSNGELLFKREDIILLLEIKDLVLNQGKSIEEAKEIIENKIKDLTTQENQKKETIENKINTASVDISILEEIKREITNILTILKKNSKT